MVIGLLRETATGEQRVALTPTAVRRLVEQGNRVFVEHNAGEGSSFPDSSYSSAGARIVFSPPEVIDRAELLVKVERPTPAESEALHAGQTVLAFFHLATATREEISDLLAKGITTIGNEIIESADGRLPVLEPMSEIAGQMAVTVASHLLRSSCGGRGILLGGAPGIAAARVIVLGAGTVGTYAARTAVSIGASTLVFDSDVQQLRRLLHVAPAADTTLADADAIAGALPEADVLIGAVLRRGDRAPMLVAQGVVESMRRGAVILDLSIDQGGCVETSRPTTLADPVFVHKGVVHYCVPNMTADIAHTASCTMSQATLPYIEAMAREGVEGALAAHGDLAHGLYTLQGHCVNAPLAKRWRMESVSIDEIVARMAEVRAWAG